MEAVCHTGSPAACAIAVMGKASISGKVKTRLVPPLTADEAVQFNTAFLQDIVDNIDAAGRHVDVSSCIAYGPAGSEDFFRALLPSRVSLLECALPDFGDCLHFTIETLLARGHASACVINSDSPTLPTAALIEAARILSLPGDRAVLGPCLDGGYYLLGVKRPHRHLFERIEWSTERVFDQTRERAREIGLPLVLLQPWYDVDDISALRRLREELLPSSPQAHASPIHGARHARAALARMLQTSGLAQRLADPMQHLSAPGNPVAG
jgi:uncharacterized protein